ncbi:lipopolysaccharide assembly protein LapB [Desulfovibrio sp. JC022]|uniref:tetratricopeptide repeat protein n=1 Tax=Desulfovibrio sp. JC022 TaxID=2593642 RepID=UPI0013D1DCF0|nr:tetratricopeptide repeat protein [Desulfovibrio sp. JC022]NDV22726.1 tetratricopeptide repeat protein [Desulfovibrio sp. JC022]
MAANRISGVFSSCTESTVGTGTTTRQTVQKTYWFAEERENGALEVQPLNSNNVPSGPKLTVERDTFLDNYHPEPEYYAEVVRPSMESLDGSIQRGEGHRSSGESYSAEYEFGHAIDVDEENVRANFGLGLTYLERGETGRAEDVFRRLVGIGAIYEPQHKHLFNDFGINLRRNGMIDQALEYYHKAEEISKHDENLCLNIARAYYEKGEFDNCIKYIKKSLKLNPELEEGIMFWSYLKGNGYISEEQDDLNIDLNAFQKKQNKSGPIADLEIDF